MAAEAEDGKVIEIELGGRTWRPKFSLSAAVAVEERIGLKLHHLVEMLGIAQSGGGGEGGGGASDEATNQKWLDVLGSLEVGFFRALQALVWASLRREDKELTEEQVGDWIDQDNAAEVMRVFFALLGGTGWDAFTAAQTGAAQALEASKVEVTAPEEEEEAPA